MPHRHKPHLLAPVQVEPAPLYGVKAATHRLLLDTAMDCIRERGHIPSVSELATQAQVSRATAYRYFPSRSVLIDAVMDRSLGPVRAYTSNNPDGRERVHELFTQTFPRFKDFEAQMRAAVQLSLEQWAMARASALTEEPYRRGHRIGILERALEPFAAQLPKATLARLHQALSMVYGIEPYVILKDIWGLNDSDVERMALWMVDALIAHALREAAPPRVVPKPAVAPPKAAVARIKA